MGWSEGWPANSKNMKLPFILILVFSLMKGYGQKVQDTLSLPPWEAGQLDIHFINTGRGNASFLILPDGTTLLVDAGDLNTAEFERTNAPMKVAPAVPDSSLRPGQWIAAYIKQVMPAGRKPVIDYALITHFHSDHYGYVNLQTPMATNGAYRLSGLTDVGDLIPIKKLIDRGYAFPTDLLNYYRNDLTFTNYQAFIRYHQTKNRLKAEALLAGHDDQIRLLLKPDQYPLFSVRNIKSNGTIWRGKANQVMTLFTAAGVLENGTFNENPLSNALKITYGPFTYYTGGDNTGYEGTDYPGRKDVETPMAKVLGKVEAMSLDHHGNRDATNDLFLKTLAPKVVIEQSWCSDQPGQELAFRLTHKNASGAAIDVFNTHMQPVTQAYLGFWVARAFSSLSGHVLIRVLEGGERYLVYVLDDQSPVLKVKKIAGPYQTNQNNNIK